MTEVDLARALQVRRTTLEGLRRRGEGPPFMETQEGVLYRQDLVVAWMLEVRVETRQYGR